MNKPILGNRNFFLLFCWSAMAALLMGCASYNQQITNYYNDVGKGNYAKANEELDKNELLKKDRNRLLFLFEKGKITHLLGKYEESNTYFNQADQLMDIMRTKPMDIVAGTLVNPMMQPYKGEIFEKYMIHYYKALNYLYLHKIDDAIVEGRRITLETNEESEGKNTTTQYAKDAFALNFQGLLYEVNNDFNNAFISYRNAADIYLGQKNDNYYGVEFPEQLKKDLLNSAYRSGITNELNRFSKILNMDYKPTLQTDSGGGALVVFWENGMAPVKEQQDFVFILTNNGGGFVFNDPEHNYVIPFVASVPFNPTPQQLSLIQTFRIAFPKYVSNALPYQKAKVSCNGVACDAIFEPAQDIDKLAYVSLKQRFLKEISIALSRLAVKKLAELAVYNSKSSKDTETEKNLKDLLGGALQVYNFVSEKADTRNWQTLPHTINYTRIPLKQGDNTIVVTLSGPKGESIKTIHVVGNGGLQLYNFSTLR